MFLLQGRELKNDERTSITSGEGVSCLLLQNITTDDSGKYDVCVENIHGADCSYASVSVEGMEFFISFYCFLSSYIHACALLVLLRNDIEWIMDQWNHILEILVTHKVIIKYGAVSILPSNMKQVNSTERKNKFFFNN